jgi:hypothetical protein
MISATTINSVLKPCMERTGTSRLAHIQFWRYWRLVPAAHAFRYAS